MDFLEYLCSQYMILLILHAAGWFGVVLNAGSWFFAGPGGKTLVLLNFVGLLILLGWTGVVIWKCRQIEPADGV